MKRQRKLEMPAGHSLLFIKGMAGSPALIARTFQLRTAGHAFYKKQGMTCFL
jgi:hypothetical protein